MSPVPTSYPTVSTMPIPPQILEEIEAASALLVVLEVAIPLGRVYVGRIRRGNDGRDAVVWLPLDLTRDRRSGEAERAVLVMRGVYVTPRQEGTNDERRVNRARSAPRQCDEGQAVENGDLVHDLEAGREDERPRRPGIVLEAQDAGSAVGMRDVGRIPLRREGKTAVGCFDPRFHSID